MKFLDLLGMSSSSLWRRKLRTILTILGVIIGTASIIVMVSLGIGLSKTTMDQIEKSGGLTTINVYGNDGGMMYYGGGVSTSDTGKSDSTKEVKLDDTTLQLISSIPHVKLASPVLTMDVFVKQGSYESHLSLRGMTMDVLKKLNFSFAEGSLPEEGSTELQLIFGNQMITNFYNARNNQYYWDTGILPDVDLVGKPLFAIFDIEAYYKALGGEGEMPKKYMINGVGLLEGSVEDYSEHAWNVYVDIDVLKTQLKRIFKNKPIPGQPTTSSGKPYKEYVYSEAYVQVDEMDNVMDVQKQINDMGFQAYSNAEYLESMQQQSRSIQAVLGGIGGVSLFVAAIGIANTMMMSIYERTKEIGIIKVLGCSLGNIRSLFLMEAAFIGFIGGILGIGLSYGISAIINTFLGGIYGYGEPTTISYIPFWLSIAALGFAVLVGIVAGFFPALRAMKLSPLAAIRNE